MGIKSQGRSLTFPKVTQFLKLYPFFSETVELVETKYNVKRFWEHRNKKYCTNGLSHMTMSAPTPINGKCLQKSSSPEPEG